jgi:hypothetical protein
MSHESNDVCQLQFCSKIYETVDRCGLGALTDQEGKDIKSTYED